jgi:putative oxygen-independent coproporphyrinogen III oxidase
MAREAASPAGIPEHRRAAGIYLHLPFCRSRCSYCTFVVSTDLSLSQRVFAALEREVERLARPAGRVVSTVYLGGGTPSLVAAEALHGLFAALRRSLRWPSAAEVTLEANPDDVTEGRLELWKTLGVTRLSIGVQAFQDRVLKVLNRRHSAAVARRAARLALDAGFVVSLDLMLGLPTMTRSDLAATLSQALDLRPHHVSVYLLEMDKPHRLARLAARRRDLFPDDDAAAAQYLTAGRALVAAGYRHYEISNFALPGFAARHNLRYWLRRPVLAAGVGAHGQAGRRRWANVADLRAYVEAIEGGGSPRAWSRTLSTEEESKEGVMLGLRLARGVDRGAIAKCAALAPEFAARLEDFEMLGLARRAAGRLRLTPQGWLVSNELFAALW